MMDILERLRSWRPIANNETWLAELAEGCSLVSLSAIEIERLRKQNEFLEKAMTKVIEDVKAALRKSTAEILEMDRARNVVAKNR